MNDDVITIALLLRTLYFSPITKMIIFLRTSKENCDLFMKDPMKYINQESYIPNLPIKLAIIGPPKSGKSKLAEELSREFGVKVVTPGQSLRYTLEEIPASSLSIAIEEKLRSGAHVPSYLLVPSIEVATMVPRGATQGFVLDGFPNTEEESQLLENLGIIPYIFIILQYSSRTSEKNLKKLSANLYREAPIYSAELLHYKYNSWKEAITKNLARLGFENKNLLFITEDNSKWKSYQDIKKKIFVVMNSYNKYFQGIGKGHSQSEINLVLNNNIALY
ncbi:adenylate kinase 9-like [Schistocerca americana]|uniref:adenylate kinase 9-like n=1 Tax=Schistocerca americana TaxID=7009 RepID=UPI001F4F5317|nr:adenylate kinase 9-like [Schistocerca americana]